MSGMEREAWVWRSHSGEGHPLDGLCSGTVLKLRIVRCFVGPSEPLRAVVRQDPSNMRYNILCPENAQ
jgi:hypothetical protein